MLKNITINNYALIEHAEIEFYPGFSVITGETGAGKSILIGALSIVLGARADTSIIKHNKNKCTVEASFDITKYNLKTFFEQKDLDFENETIIRREITSTGKSRAFINDTPVTLATLKDIAQKIIDIHSQHETLKINATQFQTNLVDKLAKNDNILLSYTKTYNDYTQISHNLKKLKTEAEQNKNQYEYLSYQYEELEKANLTADEQEKLEKQQEILENTEEIKYNLSKAASLISLDEQSVLTMLKESTDALDKIKEYHDKANELFKRIESAYIEIKDASVEIEALAAEVEHDPERLEQINQRLDLIYSLQQKHKVNSCEELITIKNDLETKLEKITSYDDQIKLTEQKQKELKKQLEDLAEKISKGRKNSAPKIEKQIKKLLADLGMPSAEFKISVEPAEDFTPNGKDIVKFLFSANNKIPVQEISKVASGGELSRLMLSLKYVLSESEKLPTIIFDEIDTGISGEIARKTANILEKMAENMQVIAITHLPQVASKGKYHYKVYKTEQKQTTKTQIKLLDKNERINEIAKMLSGENITNAALQNAKELLND